MNENYYSQYRQDKFLNEVIFQKMENGFFVDIGAHDGIAISNSLYFEKYRNWGGICVEPNPVVYTKLVENRKSINLNICIGDENKKVKFTQIEGYSEMLSGISENYDVRHIERINKEIALKGGKKTEIEVQMIPLSEIKKIKNKKIDFISVDTEGNEYDILKSIDFDLVSIKAIVVENNYKDNQIKKYLNDKGYKFVIKLESDDVYLKNSLLSVKIKLKTFLWKLKKLLKF